MKKIELKITVICTLIGLTIGGIVAYSTGFTTNNCNTETSKVNCVDDNSKIKADEENEDSIREILEREEQNEPQEIKDGPYDSEKTNHPERYSQYENNKEENTECNINNNNVVSKNESIGVQKAQTYTEVKENDNNNNNDSREAKTNVQVKKDNRQQRNEMALKFANEYGNSKLLSRYFLLTAMQDNGFNDNEIGYAVARWNVNFTNNAIKVADIYVRNGGKKDEIRKELIPKLFTNEDIEVASNVVAPGVEQKQ